MGGWIVTQDYIRGVLCYLVEHSETGERRGEFDWQAQAQEFADYLNAAEIKTKSPYILEEVDTYGGKIFYVKKRHEEGIDRAFKYKYEAEEYMRSKQ